MEDEGCLCLCPFQHLSPGIEATGCQSVLPCVTSMTQQQVGASLLCCCHVPPYMQCRYAAPQQDLLQQQKNYKKIQYQKTKKKRHTACRCSLSKLCMCPNSVRAAAIGLAVAVSLRKRRAKKVPGCVQQKASLVDNINWSFIAGTVRQSRQMPGFRLVACASCGLCQLWPVPAVAYVSWGLCQLWHVHYISDRYIVQLRHHFHGGGYPKVYL